MKPKKLLKLWLDEAIENKTKVKPLCKHFGRCGGCDLQHIEYSEQILAKKEVFNKMAVHKEMQSHFKNIDIQTMESPVQFGYRQRMDYVYAFDEAGLRIKNSHLGIVELEECPLIDIRAFTAFQEAKKLVDEQGLESYDYYRHEGYFRYFVVRQTRLGETLISLVTKTNEHADKIKIIAEKLLSEKLVDSVHWLLSPTLSDLSFGESMQFWGLEQIHETFDGKSFLVGPNTFFQANAFVAEKAYLAIKEDVSKYQPKLLMDLYTGTGVIAIILSMLVEKIIGVENSLDNEVLSGSNFKNNDINNVEFITQDVALFLKENTLVPDYIVANPPRAGIGDKAAQRLLEVGCPRIAYLSCNPLTLMNDLKILCEGYTIEYVRLHDMFPETRHFETLVFLNKK